MALLLEIFDLGAYDTQFTYDSGNLCSISSDDDCVFFNRSCIILDFGNDPAITNRSRKVSQGRASKWY